MPIPQLRKTYSPQEWKGRSHSNKKRNQKSKKNFFLSFFIVLFLGGIFATTVLAIVFFTVGRKLPNPGQILARDVPESTKIYDRTGEHLLYEIHGEESRTLVTLLELPQHIREATLIAEDKNFYNHPGIDFRGIFRAALMNLFRPGTPQGGSTITQQFIKNAVLTNERTYTRKIKEAILAYQMEEKFTKDQILEFYLNEIPYGSTAYGVESAANIYYGKSAKNLNLVESVTLAAIPKAPKYFSPLSSSYDEKRLMTRRNLILEGMAAEKYISEDETVAAKKEDIAFQLRPQNIVAPHFVFWIKAQLAELYGERMVDQGGLRIITTLDLFKQQKAEEAMAQFVDRNQREWGAKNAAMVVIDPKTGEVLAMVGSRDYFNDDIDGKVNVALSSRQPGSSLKPVVYALGFQKGFTPDTVFYDVKTEFKTDVGPKGSYIPRNYTGKFYGPVNIRKALQGSLNIPAVKMLYMVGIDNAIQFSEKLGYTTFQDRSRFGLSFVLGGGEVKLLEHVAAYGAFAREGMKAKTISILRVEDPKGKVLQEAKEPQTERVFSEEVARNINDVLSDNASRAFIFGENSYLQLGDRQVAAKTGTTSDNKDAWILGYTPSIVVGVWAGNSDGTPMKEGAGGSSVAGSIWNTFMHRILDGTPVETFKKSSPPDPNLKPVLLGKDIGYERIQFDTISGRQADSETPQEQIEEKLISQHHSLLYYVSREDPLGPPPTNPADDPEFLGWESGVKAWVQEQGISEDTALDEYSSDISLENKPMIFFVSPLPNMTISERQISVDVTTVAPRGVRKVDYYIDSMFLRSVIEPPFDLIDFVIPNALKNGFYGLRAVSSDDVGNRETAEVNINLMAEKIPVIVQWKTPQTEVSLLKKDFPFTLTGFISDSSEVESIQFFVRSLETPDALQELFYTSFKTSGNEVGAILGDIFSAGVYDVFFTVIFKDHSSQQSENIRLILEE